MSYDYKNPTNRKVAAQLLKQLWPLAEEEARKQPGLMSPGSATGRASLGQFTAAKCTGIHIYQGRLGGWFADLEFRDLPVGVGNVIGTPAQTPLASREQAIGTAVSILASCLNLPKPEGPEDAIDAVFAFDDIEMAVPAEMLRMLRARIGELPTADEARIVLEKARSDYAGGGPLTGEIAQGLSDDALKMIRFACAIALLAGLPRYPTYEEAPPPPAAGEMH
jgi:hypothetical protein